MTSSATTVPGPLTRVGGPGPRSWLTWPVLAVVALAALLVTVWATLAGGSANHAAWRMFVPLALSWVEFAVAALAVRRSSRRVAVWLIVVGGLALQLVAVSFPPRTTDDYFRYAWDGRVQAAGIDPYRYAPVDPALAGLRDDWLFPPSCRGRTPPCTRMNHPTDPTIYPPLAEGEFLAVHLVTRPLGTAGGGDLTWQVLGAGLATATTLALLLVLRRRGDPRHAVLWAWCPTVVLECGNNGHVDASAALLVVLALAAAAAGQRARAGAALGAAVAVKFLPVLVLPALLSPLRPGRVRGAVRVVTAAGVVVAAGYIPHLLAVGTRSLGFLPGYLREEGYQGNSRYPLLRMFLPNTVAALVAVAALVGIAVLVARRTDPRRPWEGAVVLVGWAFLLGGITYPWYPLLLVVLVALDGRAEWLAVAAAAYPGYLSSALHIPWSFTTRLSYAAAVVVLVVGHRLRARAARPSPRDETHRPGAGDDQTHRPGAGDDQTHRPGAGAGDGDPVAAS